MFHGEHSAGPDLLSFHRPDNYLAGAWGFVRLTALQLFTSTDMSIIKKQDYKIRTVRSDGFSKEYGTDDLLGGIAWASRAFEKGGYSRIDIIRVADKEAVKTFSKRLARRKQRK